MYPKISVITPSYNQSEFIEETINSVISQQYPNLEYIVIDGGSNDGTQEILEKYSSHFAYCVSEPDKGQANAINKGFQKATGDIICWLNSDDLFTPFALHKVSEHFQKHSSNFIYGDGLIFHDQRKFLRQRYVKCKLMAKDALTYSDPIQQPSTFWRRKVLDEVGFLDETLEYALDWEFFIRISQKFDLTYIPEPLSLYRIHKNHKSGTGGIKRTEELQSVATKYAPPDYVSIYSQLLPYASEIRMMKKVFRRFFIQAFAVRHPVLYFSNGAKKVNIVLRMG